MKKAIAILISVSLMIVSLISSTFTAHGSLSEGYAWVLVEVVDLDNQESFASYNEINQDVYRYDANYSRNNYSITFNYIGKTDTSYNPDMVQGESITFTAAFSQPPEVIYAGEEIKINISLSAGGNNLSFFTPMGSARAQIGKTGSSFQSFTNQENATYFKTDSNNNYAAFNETVTALAPDGSEGDQLEIRFYLSCGQLLETHYVYEYTMVDDTALEVEPSTPPIDEQTPESYSEPTPENCIDSGCRFSDLIGEVLIRPYDDILAWDIARLDMVICNMDHIKTSYDSHAMISLRDMTVFHLKPESEVIMNTISEEESKVSLLAGKVWVNVNKMLKDGTMNVEMSQAVAGIKGTTLVLEEDGSTSTLKVLEGTVALTTNNGETILVRDEEAVSVTDGVLGQVTSFSAEEEMENWDGIVDVKDRSPRLFTFIFLPLVILTIIGFCLVVGIIIIFMLLRKKKEAIR